jgi:hypothetical protein
MEGIKLGGKWSLGLGIHGAENPEPQGEKLSNKSENSGLQHSNCP